jgi:phosphoribosylaminoimidazolecarboxamide formyltransferase/IMP cyclohydrolase
MKKRALISVSDKTGVIELASELVSLGYEIISTGGTLKMLSDSGIPAIGVSDITGFPECLDGRVKTLHPAVHAGLLAMRSNAEHMEQLANLDINTIDVVVVNLYPFKSTIMKPGCKLADAVENIDIGGPTMLRSAAKNYQDVVVLVDPKDYAKAIEEMKDGEVSLETRFYLSYKVFQHTAVYDTLISTYMREKMGIRFPEQLTFAYEKKQGLRYGENPHQQAAYYQECLPVEGAITNAIQLHGKELSYNNINDANGALDLLREFTRPAAVAVKHANPCGVGTGHNIYDAYMKAYKADPVSIFGGIVALNGTVDKATAEEINKIFVEIVIAPEFSDAALSILKNKQNIRLLKLPEIEKRAEKQYDLKKTSGGLLIQDSESRQAHKIKRYSTGERQRDNRHRSGAD